MVGMQEVRENKMCKFCEKIYENQDKLETALYYAERADRENNKYDHENHVVAGKCREDRRVICRKQKNFSKA